MIHALAWSLVERSRRSNHGSLAFVTEFSKHPLGEVLRIVNRDFSHGIERTHRKRRIDTGHIVETGYHIVTSSDILLSDLLEILIRSIKGTDCRKLAEDRRTETGLSIFHGGLHDILIMRDDAADTGAAEVVSL